MMMTTTMNTNIMMDLIYLVNKHQPVEKYFVCNCKVFDRLSRQYMQ